MFWFETEEFLRLEVPKNEAEWKKQRAKKWQPFHERLRWIEKDRKIHHYYKKKNAIWVGCSDPDCFHQEIYKDQIELAKRFPLKYD